MNRYLSKAIIALLASTIIYSCEEKELQSNIRISIENFSNIAIDTLKIYSSSNLSIYSILQEPIIFWNLIPGSITNKIDRQDIETTLHFEAYIEGDVSKGRWHFPGSPVDPTEPAYFYIPSGVYHFIIIECDTVNNRMVIGLISR